MDKILPQLGNIEKKAKKIYSSSYSLDRREVLIKLEKMAWKLWRKDEINTQTKKTKDIIISGIRILSRLEHMREDYIKTAGNVGQYYTEDMEISEQETIPIGFHKGYNTKKTYWIIKYLNCITVFPHYCFSYHDLCHGKLIQEQSDEFPAIYRSLQCYNFGENSIFTIWDDFMLFMGWPEMILKDKETLSGRTRG